jgi:hypothetical protein
MPTPPRGVGWTPSASRDGTGRLWPDSQVQQRFHQNCRDNGATNPRLRRCEKIIRACHPEASSSLSLPELCRRERQRRIAAFGLQANMGMLRRHESTVGQSRIFMQCGEPEAHGVFAQHASTRYVLQDTNLASADGARYYQLPRSPSVSITRRSRAAPFSQLIRKARSAASPSPFPIA